MRKHRWILKPVRSQRVVEQLQQELNNLAPALSRSLVLRGISTFNEARGFFRAGLELLHDPFLMNGMEEAVNRIIVALDKGETILVYGDYDVDGTSSTALLVHFLQHAGGKIEFFIPNRLTDGYGLSRTGIDSAIEKGASLICALDCGTTAVDEAAYASEQNVDLIICDHHTPQASLPEALAVLNPKRADCRYPFSELCACGVTFKLVQGLIARMGLDPADAWQYLDLVALATASDIVPVVDENRILLREGIERIRREPRLGLLRLAEEAHVRLRDCSATTILFGIGPRINAAGRLGDAERAVTLFLSENDLEARARARQLERLNRERRLLDQDILDEALKLAERALLARDRHSIVLHRPEWHIGVIGIVASRLVDRFYRPAIMLTTINGHVKGSARSVNGINVFEAIQGCRDLLVDFGGHDFAAGVTLLEENVAAFVDRFEEMVSMQSVDADLDPIIDIDAELRLSDIDTRFWSILRQFEPFGPGNTAPIFHTRDLTVSGEPRLVGRDQGHLKFMVENSGKGDAPREVIGFRMSDYVDIVRTSQTTGAPIELLYSVQENSWNGRSTLQLRARDLKLQEA